ncbi:MAG: general secretion pathway protein J [Methyloprofundus sp.]|nr:MAG: general secretion pathway protein J [Methyloprofundus sp.]
MKYKGFTLIELLIAISILAILLSLAYSGLNSVLLTHQRITEQQQRLQQFNYTFTQLHSEIQHIVPRTVTDSYRTPLAALLLTESNDLQFSFTRAGHPNPSGIARSSLQRIDYYLQDKTLYKRIWFAPDNTETDNYREQQLLANVTQVTIQVLAYDKRWYSNWPPQNAPLNILPLALKISMSTPLYGDFEQIIELPQ